MEAHRRKVQREDFFSARICAVLANCNRTKATDKKWDANDFMVVKLSEAPAPKTVAEMCSEDEMLKRVEFLNIMFGGKDLR